MHVLQIHGTADTVVQYGGGVVPFPGGGAYPGAVETAEQWVFADGCSSGFVTLPSLDLDAGIPGLETTVRQYASDCLPGGSGELWTIVGGSHLPMFSAGFSPSVVEFLLAHPKPALFRRGDDNGDGTIDIGDSVYQFSGGSAPPPPFGTCGVDLTDDALGADCSDFSGCP